MSKETKKNTEHASVTDYLSAVTLIVLCTHSLFHPEKKEVRKLFPVYSVDLVLKALSAQLGNNKHLGTLSLFACVYVLAAGFVSYFRAVGKE